jgi:hypothetical protein
MEGAELLLIECGQVSESEGRSELQECSTCFSGLHTIRGPLSLQSSQTVARARGLCLVVCNQKRQTEFPSIAQMRWCQICSPVLQRTALEQAKRSGVDVPERLHCLFSTVVEKNNAVIISTAKVPCG